MTIIISHRANLVGLDGTRDNEAQAVQQCLALGLDVLIDVWNADPEHVRIGPSSGHSCSVPVKLIRNPHIWCRAHSLEVLLELKLQKAKHFLITAAGPTLTSCQHFWTEEHPDFTTAFEFVAGNAIMQHLDPAASDPRALERYRVYYAICSDHPLDWQRKLL